MNENFASAMQVLGLAVFVAFGVCAAVGFAAIGSEIIADGIRKFRRAMRARREGSDER